MDPRKMDVTFAVLYGSVKETVSLTFCNSGIVCRESVTRLGFLTHRRYPTPFVYSSFGRAWRDVHSLTHLVVQFGLLLMST
jgi:hypothetical protein